MFFEFCHHCGNGINQPQTEGQMLVCKHCGQEIGIPTGAPKKVMVDQSQDLINQGKAARCALCGQLVDLKGTAPKKTFVPHYKEGKKICPGSGKTPA